MPADRIEIQLTDPNSPTARESRVVSRFLASIALHTASVRGRGVVLDALLSVYLNLAVRWIGAARAQQAIEDAKAHLPEIERLHAQQAGRA